MIFLFLKYLQPIHYFRKVNKSGNSIFPIVNQLPSELRDNLDIDLKYQSEIAKAYDLSWQAIQRGYIGEGVCYSNFEPLSIQDNYHFIRKNFHSAWVFYVLLIRLFSFHNPFKEIRAWFKSRFVRRISEGNHTIQYPEWTNFESHLIKQNSKVSVVIPTLNRYSYLNDVLKDFEKQDYTNFEIVVVDQSEPFNPEFYKDFNLNINVIRQEEKALWLARNTAIKNAAGSLIALSEDDVRIKPDWISTHMRCLDFFNAEVSAGVFYPKGKEIPKSRSYFSLATQFATGNAMLFKTVFKTTQLFDRQFEKQRMGDGEFGMRVYLEGIKSVSNPYASCIDVKAGTGGLREMGSWDAFRPSTFFSPRPIPSVLYYFRKYYGNKAARLALLRTIPISVFPYQFKKNKPLLIIGLFVTLLIFPIVMYQVFKSWKLASIKLKEGHKIETFS